MQNMITRLVIILSNVVVLLSSHYECIQAFQLFTSSPRRQFGTSLHTRETSTTNCELLLKRMRHDISFQYLKSTELLSSPKDDFDKDDDEDEDDEEVDMNALGDWRAFRMNLAETGLPTDETSATKSSADDESGISSSPSSRRPKSVSKLNEEVLMDQNEELAKEYMGGIWAHDVGKPEVGGLVCRMPLEAEIWRVERRTSIGRKLQDRLDLDNNDLSSSSSSTFASSSPVDEPKALSSDTESSSPGLSFSPLAAKTAYWYKGAQAIVQEELKKITDAAEKNGQVDPSKLSDESLELLQLYLDYQETWQEVCLVLDNNDDIGSATTLAINRPITMKLTEDMARLVLFGSKYKQAVSQTQDLVRFLIAFENECAVYIGGPDMHEDPAILIHGIKDLPGAVEISPGSDIYKGGLDAAISGVMSGKYKPLDFRFIIGRHRYTNHALDQKVAMGKYQPIACARPLALKQCISLPKPLWHEVLELCGGELKEISSLELMKRTDLRVVEEEEDSDNDRKEDSV